MDCRICPTAPRAVRNWIRPKGAILEQEGLRGIQHSLGSRWSILRARTYLCPFEDTVSRAQVLSQDRVAWGQSRGGG